MGEPPIWVFDTNVVVSGLLSPFAPPGRLLDLILGRALHMAYDDRIEAEYREALSRPLFRIPAGRREAFLAILLFQRHVTAGPWPHPPSPDPDDQTFLEVAAATVAQTLVTGNARHFPNSCRGPVRVLSPAEAWRELGGG